MGEWQEGGIGDKTKCNGMSNNTLKLLGAGVIAALLIGVVSFFHGGKQGPQGPAGPKGLGAVASPYTEQPVVCINGICDYGFSGDCSDATTTLFRIPTPNAATSTVTFLEVNIRQSGTSSVAVYAATTTQENGYALPTAPAGATSTGLINGYYLPTATTTVTLVNGSDSVENGGPLNIPSKARIQLKASGAGSYLTGSVFSNAGAAPAGVINPTNTFTCSFNTIITQPRRTIGN